jgi:hypothetical protein
VQRIEIWVGRADDEGSATSPAPSFDDSLVSQRLERVADGGGGDTEHDRQLIFDRELLTPPEKSERDRG